jgi:two-component system, NtrC family, response regulator HydG
MSRVLLVDDEPRFCQATSETLRRHGHQVVTANCLAAAREALRVDQPDIVLLDLMLPDGNGLELLDRFGSDSSALVALVTGHPAIKAHIQTLTGPTVTYLTKPVSAEEILRLVGELDDRESETDTGKHFGALIGETEAMRKVYASIEQLGPTDATVLIVGPSGTGKELVAKALHGVSHRSGRFVPTNCGALAGELVASELFGHEKGSFTGATRRHAGVFERANGGTLFLDEISEMPLDMQTYLLRSLETGEIVRVGGETETKVDARLLAATNRTLAEIGRDGSLREDLFYRISEFVIALPALRERVEDIALLIEHFVAELNRHYGDHKEASARFIEQCKKHSWPGNVRELKHVVHRAYLLAENGELPPPDTLTSPFADGDPSAGLEAGRAIRDVERDLIFNTLRYFDGDKKVAAESLGISLKTLYNRLNEYHEQTPEASPARKDRL